MAVHKLHFEERFAVGPWGAAFLFFAGLLCLLFAV